MAVAVPSPSLAGAVAEAAFIADTLPPASRDLNLSLGVTRGETPEDGGPAPLVTMPRLQIALPLAARVGLTADIGLLITSTVGESATDGLADLDTPSISLKCAIAPEGEGATALSASADLYGSTHSIEETEAGVSLGAIRRLGFTTLRGAGGLASALGHWDPHLHAGASLAVEPWQDWRFFGEVVGTWSFEGEDRWLALAPAVKRSFGRTALMAAVRVGVVGSDDVTGMLQLTVGL